MARKPPFAKGQNRCIFCDKTPTTLEHILPEWMRQILLRSPTDTHTEGALSRWWDENGHLRSTETKKTKQGRIGTIKIPVVRIPTEAGRVFRYEAGHRSGMKPAVIPV